MSIKAEDLISEIHITSLINELIGIGLTPKQVEEIAPGLIRTRHLYRIFKRIHGCDSVCNPENSLRGLSKNQWMHLSAFWECYQWAVGIKHDFVGDSCVSLDPKSFICAYRAYLKICEMRSWMRVDKQTAGRCFAFLKAIIQFSLTEDSVIQAARCTSCEDFFFFYHKEFLDSKCLFCRSESEKHQEAKQKIAS
jgi:hypothetical protein